jgi:hypothetical protein
MAKKRIRRWLLLLVTGVLLGTPALVLLTLFLLSRKDYAEDFRRRAGRLAGVSVESFGRSDGMDKQWVRLTSSSGLGVTCGILVPLAAGVRHPAIVLLGGKATGKHAVDYAFGAENVLIIALDYPYSPPESYTVLRFIGDVPAIRRAIFEMVPSVMLVAEYLRTRPDVDTTRVILMGYSFGAPFVPVIAAEERRFAKAILVFGGGDVGALIRHNVRRFEDEWVAGPAGWLGGLLSYPLEPLRFIGDVSPTPVLMINGTEDEQIPRVNAQMLFDRAREPKEIVWLESRHVHPRNTELTKLIISVVEREMRERGMVGSSPVR